MVHDQYPSSAARAKAGGVTGESPAGSANGPAVAEASLLPDDGSTLPVTRGDPVADSGWDAALLPCPGATFFHGSAWSRVLQETYQFEPLYLVQRTPARLASLLPLMGINSWLTGRRGVALPFTDEAAPLCREQAAFDALYSGAAAAAVDRRWKYLEVRGGLRFFPGAIPSVSFVGHRLDLQGPPDALFGRCESSVRRAVRKAEQGNLSVEFATSLESVRVFHQLLCKTRRRHGVPPQPLAFFEQIHRHVLAAGQGCVVLVRSGVTPVAGAVYFHFGSTVTYKFGASDEQFQQLRANNLVMWSAIKHFAARGFSTLDFGRSSLANVGLQKFKLGWGTVEHPIDYVRRNLRSGQFVTVGDGAAGWHTRAMTKLPDPVFKLIGSMLYKHMA